jgi:hypothetical protein
MISLTAMEAKAIEQIQEELLDVLTELSISQQEEVLDFALFLHHKAQMQNQRLIEPETGGSATAGILKAEFAEEDTALTEAVMPDLSLLQRQDKG